MMLEPRWGRHSRQPFLELRRLLLLMPGQQPEQIAVGQCPQHLRPVAEVVQAGCREDLLPVFVPQAVERGQGKPISAIKALERFEQLGFSLVVGGLGLRCGAPGSRAPGSRRFCAIWDCGAPGFGVLGLGLRCRLRAYNFVDSHGLPASMQVLRLGRVRCL
jgi:hypothetical protein